MLLHRLLGAGSGSGGQLPAAAAALAAKSSNGTALSSNSSCAKQIWTMASSTGGSEQLSIAARAAATRSTTCDERKSRFSSFSPVLCSSNNFRNGGYDIYAKDSFGEYVHFPDVVSEQSFKVPSSFDGSVWVNSPLNVKLKPAGTLDYPNLDQAFVKLLSRNGGVGGGGGVDDGSAGGQRKKTEVNGVSLQVSQEGTKLRVEADYCDEKTSRKQTRKQYLADIEVPIVHNISVEATGEACVDVHDFMESNFIHLSSQEGRITAHKLKTANLNIQTQTGDVICHGQLHGNIKIASESGTVIAEKRFVGPNVEVETENGDIRVASSYCDQAKFATSKGNMNLRNIHNESYVVVYEQGDVKIQGIDGSTNIFVKKGDVDAQVSKISHESRIHVEEGDIHLRLNENFPLKISIEANDIIPDAKFGAMGKVDKRDNGTQHVHYFAAIEPNKFSPTLVVVAENGNVILDSQDWAASLGLKLARPNIDALNST